MSFLIGVQDLAFSTWIRESDWALFAFLIVHTAAIGFLVGTSLLSTLTVFTGSRVLKSLVAVRPLLLLALSVGIASGVLLVMSYPAKALTNPLFYVKMALVIAGTLLLRKILARGTEHSHDPPSRVLVACTAAIWLCALFAGKFLAYTNTMLLVY